MDLKGIMLSEKSQTEKDKYHKISLARGILNEEKNKTKQNPQTHRYRGVVWGWVKWVEGVKKFKPLVIK